MSKNRGQGARVQRQPYVVGAMYKARCEFTYAGQKFERGDDFPGKGAECNGRMLRVMYNARRIDPKGLVTAKEAAVPALAGA